MATVCSNCADNFPSTVLAVQPLASSLLNHVPSLIIDSIVMTMPSFNLGPFPGEP